MSERHSNVDKRERPQLLAKFEEVDRQVDILLGDAAQSSGRGRACHLNPCEGSPSAHAESTGINMETLFDLAARGDAASVAAEVNDRRALVGDVGTSLVIFSMYRRIGAILLKRDNGGLTTADLSELRELLAVVATGAELFRRTYGSPWRVVVDQVSRLIELRRRVSGARPT